MTKKDTVESPQGDSFSLEDMKRHSQIMTDWSKLVMNRFAKIHLKKVIEDIERRKKSNAKQ